MVLFLQCVLGNSAASSFAINFARRSIIMDTSDVGCLMSDFGKFRLNRRRLSVICDDDDGGSENKNYKASVDLPKSLKTVIELKKRGSRNVSGVTLERSVKELCTIYNEVDAAEKYRFLENLAEFHRVDRGYVNTVASSLLSSQHGDDRLKLEEELRSVLVPEYYWLFLQVGKLENGVKFLVDLRSDIIELARLQKSEYLTAMNENLRELIALWFSIGFLQLERITWQSSSDMLQKISEYEAVHPMKNLIDLKRRVGPYRRCFVFTHRSMPDEPIVVLHTALTQNIVSNITSIVKPPKMMSVDGNATDSEHVEDPNLCDTAIFYSITSTQKGLLGIELGNFLIKRVVKELQTEFPRMKRYSTLSPIPGFKNWLIAYINKQENILTPDEENDLKEIWKFDNHAELKSLILKSFEANQFLNDAPLLQKYEKILMRLCAVYLAQTKRNGYAYDPVAHFHLKNGAVMWRLNWLADTSPKGLSQSLGMMVNYRYFLEDCDENSKKYVEEQYLKIGEDVAHILKI